MSRPSRDEVVRFMASATDRQLGILIDLAELRYFSTSQVVRLHYGGPEITDASAERMARRDLARLVDTGALISLKHRAGYRPVTRAGIYGLGGLGRRVITALSGEGIPRSRTYREPGGPFVEHTLAVSEAYVRLREAERQGAFAIEAFHGEPNAWRDYVGADGATSYLKPDAFAITAQGHYEDSWFVEVDLATERRGALKRKLSAYIDYFRSGQETARSGVFPRVIWLVPERARRHFLEGIIEEMGGPVGLFTVVEGHRVIEAFAGEGMS